MSKYVYPAVFTPEEEGGYSIYFPDLEGCCTCGDTLAEGLEMAEDALCLFLYDMEEKEIAAHEPTALDHVKCEKGEFATLIRCDTLAYRKFFDKKAVKKTLTIPSWLNKLAERNDVNFSALLQRALMQELNL